MRKAAVLIILTLGARFSALAQGIDSTKVYRKRVLENTEVEFLMSLYKQEGENSAVGGGVGNEHLVDATPTIVVSMPLNDDDVLTIDAGISAYSSASSSNINPFYIKNTSTIVGYTNTTGASRTIRTPIRSTSSQIIGTPWLASTGASKSDVLTALHVDYSHSSKDRNLVWGPNVSISNEYDYTSFGFGGNIARQFNQKNTEIGLKGNVYLDKWRPIYPTELHEFNKYGDSFLSNGYFLGVDVIDQNGNVTKDYYPGKFTAITNRARNSYSASFVLSQILSKRMQASLFFDLLMQQGLLSTPYHRIYFAVKPNYYIGDKKYIPIYTSPENIGVFQLADDIERLPSTRKKLPIGARLNYYINESYVLRTYYRFYIDDWGVKAHTVNLDLPIRLNQKFSVTPSYRFYIQNAAKYYAPYETHFSTEQYYTSDPDLAKFHSNQYSIALNYNDIFNDFHISKFGLKNANIKYSHYMRSDGLHAGIVTLGFKFIFK